MEGNTSACNESLQDCSDSSFRLAMTEETRVAGSVERPCTHNDSKVSDLSAVACDSRSFQSYGIQSNTSQLLIHESGDDDSDYDNLNAHSIKEERDRPHSVSEVESKINRKNSRDDDVYDTQPVPSGLMIKESDDEETDVSDNESDKLHDGKRGFSSPDTLQRVHGDELDVTCETDRSDAEYMFSPEVVGTVKSEKDEDSLDYMLVATQAYGVDYCEDDTEIEESLKFECNDNIGNPKEEKSADVLDGPKAISSVASIEKEVTQKPLVFTSKDAGDTSIVSNRRISAPSKEVCGVKSLDQECDTLDLNGTSSFGFNLPQEGSWQDSVTLPMDVPASNGEASGTCGVPEPENSGFGDEQECKTVPLGGSNVEEDGYMSNDLVGTDRTSNNKKGNASLGSDRERVEGSNTSWKGHDMERSIQEAPTVPLEQELRIVDIHSSPVDCDSEEKREDDRVPFSRIAQEGTTIPLEGFKADVDKVEEQEAVNKIQQEEKTLILEEYSMEVDTEGKKEEEPVVGQEEKTLVLEEYNVEVDTEGKKEEEPVIWNEVGPEEKTLILEDHSTDVLNRLQQDCTVPLEDYNARVESEKKEEEATIPLHRIGQEDKTVALHEDVNSEELLKYECDSSEAGRGSEGFEGSSKSKTARTSAGYMKKFHRKKEVCNAVAAKEVNMGCFY